MRHTTASVLLGLLYLVLLFCPVACMENLFAELGFYITLLVTSFFAYTLFPEVLIHDFMAMNYLALFTIPEIMRAHTSLVRTAWIAQSAGRL